MANTDNAGSNNADRKLKITREAYDIVVAMKLGLGSNRIAQGLGLTHAAVLSRQNTLEKLGVISKGTMGGERRQIILADSEFQVEAEHRSTVSARAAADREQAAARDAEEAKKAERLANLAKAREVKKARRSEVAAETVVAETVSAETAELVTV